MNTFPRNTQSMWRKELIEFGKIRQSKLTYPGIKPRSPELAGRFLTTETPFFILKKPHTSQPPPRLHSSMTSDFIKCSWAFIQQRLFHTSDKTFRYPVLI